MKLMKLTFEQSVKVFRTILGDFEANEQEHLPSYLGGTNEGRPSMTIYVKQKENGSKELDFYDFKHTYEGGVIGGNAYSLVKIYQTFKTGVMPSHNQVVSKLKSILASELVNSSELENRLRKAKVKTPPKVKIRKKLKHIDFWKKRGFTKKWLRKNHVFELKSLTFSSGFVITSTEEEPRYVYLDPDYPNFYQVYTPNKDSFIRFYSQGSSIISGVHLYKGRRLKHLIIAASRKDALCLRKLGFNAINVWGESSYRPVLNALEDLKAITDNIVCLYDNDAAGLKSSKSLHERSNGTVKVYPLHKILRDGEDFAELYMRLPHKKIIKKLNKYL